MGVIRNFFLEGAQGGEELSGHSVDKEAQPFCFYNFQRGRNPPLLSAPIFPYANHWMSTTLIFSITTPIFLLKRENLHIW